ncbi:hypothetical protein CANTEDRAFT_117073 [Yamadazyma tenuis ATCC 10573]|uniref:Uncharacterized protein n=1 Tax=Candida tenuis (strain ATCC 10573 / BCRC 21748 / CBS 615 / JCM 9827 / NBRC 10315 / NRRL Y-1498 / VKM Y-70) TaxID=590646 RepID=G3AXC5_CANTC|nr:uncharacterized protein CANTEDRAFT_117073 [Yamadazyma tenuis ATCC 10573]EGV66339.1 hypothetical protein CANTEDRAFT_117073 [Yamadazyma tenuis ATCC 10573]
MSGNGIKALSFLLVGSISWYAGVKFWQPLIVEQLKKDGNLRTDVEIPEIETQPESWEDVKSSIRATIHPEVEAKKDNKFAQSLNENVVEIQQNKESNSGK